jgi:hypothetical protein
MRKTKPTKLSWYTARCHFRSEVHSKHAYGTHLWEEAFILVHAMSKKHAERKAKHLAQRKKRTYKNFAGDVVAWRFAGVVDLCALTASSFGDGAEVYARFFSRDGELDTSVRNNLKSSSARRTSSDRR